MDFDLMWIVWFLVVVVVFSVAYWIIRTLIMPVVPAGIQPVVWAIIGLVLLVSLVFFVAGHVPMHHVLSR
jgi:hypothetical protein